MPAKAGHQNIEYSLDSPVSSTGQAQSRASLEFIRRMLDGMTKRNDKLVLVVCLAVVLY